MYIWPSGGPDGDMRGRCDVQTKVCSEEDAMAIGNPNSVTADIGGGRVYLPQKWGGLEAPIKICKGIMYSKVDMAAGRSGDITTEVRESEHKGYM